MPGALDDFGAAHVLPEPDGMQSLLVHHVDRVRRIRRFLGNEQVALAPVRQRNRHEHAFHGSVSREDRVRVSARYAVLLLDLLSIHCLEVARARGGEHRAERCEHEGRDEFHPTSLGGPSRSACAGLHIGSPHATAAGGSSAIASSLSCHRIQ